MKPRTIHDTFGERTTVECDGDEIVVTVYHAFARRGEAKALFSREHSRELRKALKRAERELSA